MSKLILLVVFAVTSVASAQYAYNVTVYLGNNKWSPQNGKLKATFLGGNGQYNHTVVLSPANEPLSPGQIKVVTV